MMSQHNKFSKTILSSWTTSEAYWIFFIMPTRDTEKDRDDCVFQPLEAAESLFDHCSDRGLTRV